MISQQTALIIRDTISDIRFCRREIAAGVAVEMNERYMNTCLKDLYRFWGTRHRMAFDPYGYPK